MQYLKHVSIFQRLLKTNKRVHLAKICLSLGKGGLVELPLLDSVDSVREGVKELPVCTRKHGSGELVSLTH